MARRVKKRYSKHDVYMNVVGMGLITDSHEPAIILSCENLRPKTKFCFRLIDKIKFRLSVYEYELLALNAQGIPLGQLWYDDVKRKDALVPRLLNSFEGNTNLELMLVAQGEGRVLRKKIQVSVIQIKSKSLKKRRRLDATFEAIPWGKIRRAPPTANFALFENESDALCELGVDDNDTKEVA